MNSVDISETLIRARFEELNRGLCKNTVGLVKLVFEDSGLIRLGNNLLRPDMGLTHQNSAKDSVEYFDCLMSSGNTVFWDEQVHVFSPLSRSDPSPSLFFLSSSVSVLFVWSVSVHVLCCVTVFCLLICCVVVVLLFLFLRVCWWISCTRATAVWWSLLRCTRAACCVLVGWSS